MSMFGIFVLTSAIGLSSVRDTASNSQDAYKAVIKATYIQTETDLIFKELEKKYVPKVLKEYGGWITGVGKLVTEQKISLEWRF